MVFLTMEEWIMKQLHSKEYDNKNHLMNPRRPYTNANSTDISQSPAWKKAVALRDRVESAKIVRLVKQPKQAYQNELGGALHWGY